MRYAEAFFIFISVLKNAETIESPFLMLCRNFHKELEEMVKFLIKSAESIENVLPQPLFLYLLEQKNLLPLTIVWVPESEKPFKKP